MSASITLTFSPEILPALRKGVPLTFALADAPRAAPRRAGPRRRKESAPREGSLPARLDKFAEGRRGTFTTADVMKAFRLSRAHASMLLSKAVSSGSLKREGRGVYVAT